MATDVIFTEDQLIAWAEKLADPPRPTVWICSCGHEEAAHIENPEDGLWPCIATSECYCANFEVWS